MSSQEMEYFAMQVDTDLVWCISLVGLCLKASDGLRSGACAVVWISAQHGEAALDLARQGMHGIRSAHLHTYAS